MNFPAAYLSQFGHGLAGDDFVAVQPGDEAKSLELALSPFQFPKDQGSEYLHLLREKKCFSVSLLIRQTREAQRFDLSQGLPIMALEPVLKFGPRCSIEEYQVVNLPWKPNYQPW